MEMESLMPELVENVRVQESTLKKKREKKIVIICLVSMFNVGLVVFILIQILTPAPVKDPLVGHPAPDFTLVMLNTPSLENGKLSLSSFRGKPVVLNFWASWCQPCKEELPLLENTWKQLQAQHKGIVFLGINFQESSTDAARFLQQYGITYLAGLDTDGSIANKYNVTSLPQTFFIDRNGTITSREPQELTAKELSQNLQAIVS
jgi:cytochrome c biogenesis protein CcmG, thiol:disulfide interchange protein DsbE